MNYIIINIIIMHIKQIDIYKKKETLFLIPSIKKIIKKIINNAPVGIRTRVLSLEG